MRTVTESARFDDKQLRPRSCRRLGRHGSWQSRVTTAGAFLIPMTYGPLTPSPDNDGKIVHGSEIPGNAEERPGGWNATVSGALPEPSQSAARKNFGVLASAPNF